MTPDDFIELRAIQWWHRIDLGDGVVTLGRDPTQWKIDLLKLPADLRGERVLDVACWDGAIAFECERRGADLVYALDDPDWAWGKIGTGRRGFDFAKRILGSQVRAVESNVFMLPTFFDRIIAAGLLYHLRHPLRWLECAVAALAHGGRLHIETHVMIGGDPEPLMRFYENDELGEDPSNWWGPNVSCVLGMMRAAGLVNVEHVGTYGDRAAFVGSRPYPS